jgi:threonine dehydratase
VKGDDIFQESSVLTECSEQINSVHRKRKRVPHEVTERMSDEVNDDLVSANRKVEDTVLREPTISEVYKAREIVSKHLRRTPFFRSLKLSHALGFDAYVKYENLQITGAFKVRGGVNLMASLSEEERRRGVATASTGNHGQSIAYAAQLFGVKAIIAMPEDSNPLKVEAIRRLGGDIAFHGKDFDEARVWVEKAAKREGYRYVHSGNEPLLIAGVGTLYLEMMEDEPDIDTIIVPVGGGSGVSAACIVAKHVNPEVRVVGVQAEKAPAVYRSWKSGKWVETDAADTFAEGLATRAPFQLPLQIMRRMLDDFALVSEEEIQRAVLTLFETTHQVAEGAGAAATAAAFKMRTLLKDRKVGLLLSGGNLTLNQLRTILRRDGS